MNRFVSKLVSVFLVITMLFTLTSCDFRKKDREEIFRIADKVADGVCGLNYLRIRRLSTSDCKDDLGLFDMLSRYYEFSEYSDRSELIEAVLSTMTYTINEESYLFSEHNKVCSLQVIFNVADFEQMVTDFDVTKDRETFIEAASTYARRDYKLSITFCKEDGKWGVGGLPGPTSFLMTMYDKIRGFEFHPDLDTSVRMSSWSGTASNRYGMTRSLSYNLDFIADVSDSQIQDITFVVSHDGEDVYEGAYTSTTTHDFHADCYAEGTIADDGNGYFKVGEYEITFFDGDGNAFFSDTCDVLEDSHEEVIVEPEEEEEDPTSSYFGPLPSGYVRYVNQDSEFYTNTSEVIFCDVNALSQVFTYSSGEDELQVVCEAFNGFSERIGFTWYYSSTDDFNEAEEIYSGTSIPTDYFGHSVYLFELSERSSNYDIVDGSYWCVITSTDGQTIYVVGYVRVE